MSNFLTLEDINSTFMNFNKKHGMHVIDTSKIPLDSDFEDVNYDFVTVKRTLNLVANYEFEFNIRNIAWTGYYFVKKIDDSIIPVRMEYKNGKLNVVSSEKNIKLYLYINNFHKTVNGFNARAMNNGCPVSFENHVIDYNTTSESVVFRIQSYSNNDDLEITTNVTGSSVEYIGDGLYELTVPKNTSFSDPTRPADNLIVTIDNVPYYYPTLFKKKRLVFEDMSSGIIPNKVNDFFIRTGELNIDRNNVQFFYNDVEIPFTFIGINGYSIFGLSLDLTGKKDFNNVDIRIVSQETEKLLYHDEIMTLKIKKASVNSLSQLKSEIRQGTPFITLSANIDTVDENIVINNNCIIDLNNNDINLNGHGFIIQEDCNVTMKNGQLNMGKNAILQEKNTELKLDRIVFDGNTGELGACVYCDIDVDSLSVEDDFKTTITNCTFFDNNSCILHGGELIIKDSKFHNINTMFANKYYPAFLYQADGTAELKKNTFDIDYSSDDYCANQENIGFAQALVHIGYSAIVNNCGYDYLKNNGVLNFFGSVYNNRSHVFCKYYYPEIESCVYTSPEVGFEDKSLCYSLSEDNYVYKLNAKVTRADMSEENRLNKIEW